VESQKVVDEGPRFLHWHIWQVTSEVERGEEGEYVMFTLHVLFPLVDYECISPVGLFDVGVFSSNDANLPDRGELALQVP